MKALWKKHRLLFLGLLALVCLLVLVAGWSAFQADPRTDSVYISDPTAVLFGPDGKKYIIAEGSTSILVLNEEDQYLRTLSGGQQSQGFYYAQSLAADEEGNLYISDKILGENGKDIQSERIAVYDKNGGFVDYLYELPRESTQGDNRVRIQDLRWRDGKLWFVQIEQEGLRLCTLDKDTGEQTEAGVYPCEDAWRKVMYAAVSPEGTVYFTDKYGALYQASEEGSHTLLYDPVASGEESSIASNLVCAADGSIYFNDLGKREIRRITPEGQVETAVGQGEPMVEKPEAFNELPIYSFVTLTPEENLAAIYCEYYFDETIDDYTYDYCIYVKDAEGQALLNTAEVSKALPVRLWGYAACGAIVLLVVLAVLCLAYVLRAGWLSRITPKSRIHLAVIVAAVLGAAVTATVVVGDLNDRYIQERISKMTNMAVLMARDLDAEDIASLDSPQAYDSPAYQRIDESVQEIMDSDINKDGAYCTLYREKDGVVCIVYSDEGLNNVLYPMSGVFEGSYEAEIYETGQLKQFSAFSSADGHYAFTLAPITDENGEVVGLIEVGTDLYAFTASNQALIRETLLTVLMVVVTCVLLFSESTVFFSALRRNRQEKRQHLLRDVGIVRPIAFLIFFAGNMSTAFLPVYGMGLWDSSMGIQKVVASAIPLSAEVLVTAIFSFLGGFLVDKIGTKPLIAVGSVLFMGGLGLCGAAPDLRFLIGASVVLGVGEGLVLVALNTFISNYGEEEQRNRGFSGYNAAYLSGVNCGTVVGSLAAEQFGYRNVFYIAVVVTAVALLLAIFCLHKQSVGGETEEEEKGMSTWAFLFKPRVFFFFLFMLTPYLICASFLSYFFPIFGDENGLSASFVAQAFLISGVVAIYLGPTLTKVVTEKLGARGGLILATGIYVAAFLLFALYPTVEFCFVIILLLAVADSFGLSMQAVYFSALPEVRVYGSGKAMGINSAVESIAQTVGPMIFAAVLLLGVEKGVMTLGLGVGVLLLLFIFSTLRDRKKEKRHNG